ncbi:MAG: hypothetical protein K6C11_01495 [Bacilli bacterium]|nr:hypothetical protein [Bacilli bacterium]
MHAIACVILMIGLLKFAQDAPDLLKTLFSNGSSLLKGMNLNPKGQLKNDITGAAKTAVGAGKLGAGIGKGAAGAVAGFGKGAVGAYAGAKNGFRTGKGSETGLGGFFHGMAGGARGMVAGGSAGAHHVGFRGTGSAAAFAGAGAGRISAQNRKSYADAQGRLNTTVSSLMDLNKAAIDKQKDKKTDLQKRYDNNLNKYVTDHIQQYSGEAMNGEAAINAYVNSMNDAVNTQMAATNQSREQVMADQQFMNSARENADAIRKRIASIEASKRANAEAEGIYKSAFEAEKSSIENKIASLQGATLAGNEGSVNRALDDFYGSQKNWGEFVSDKYISNLDAKMSDIKDPELSNLVNSVLDSVNHKVDNHGNTLTYAGEDHNAKIDRETVDKLMDSINTLSQQGPLLGEAKEKFDNQTTVMAQILNAMDGAAKKTNTNITVEATTLSTYAPSSSGNKSEGK